MRDASGHSFGDNQGLWQQQVQLSQGQWRREDAAGAIRSAGWWESVTVIWPPAGMPERRPPLLQSALVAAFDRIAPSILELMAVSARRLLERQDATRAVLPSARRQLGTATRELPQTRQAP